MYKAFIGGNWVTAKSGGNFKVENPATGEVVAEVADCTATDMLLAVDAASRAFERWRFSSVKERVALLLKIKENLIADKAEIADLLMQENGKPLNEALGEVDFSISFFQWFAEEARRIYGETIQTGIGQRKLLTVRHPVGVAGMITPWNFPIAMMARKVSAAVASGCSCIVKPAEDTPISALMLAKAIEKSGAIPGLVNVVPCSRENTSAVGKIMCHHQSVRAVSFTGSSAIGKILYSQCADSMKKISMELGGDAPFIVFPSANMQTAVNNAFAAKFRNNGQTCVSANRFLVHSSIAEEFAKQLSRLMDQKLVVGNGKEQGVTQGPMINKKQHERLCNLVENSVKKGAKVMTGGKPLKGLFYEGTILTNVTEDMPVFKEEIFGPVVTIKTFETEEEAVRIANNTDRGLAGFVFSNNLSESMRVVERLELGMVGLNDSLISTCEAPFGGVKHSGFGKEGSKYGLDEFTEIKYVCVNYSS